MAKEYTLNDCPTPFYPWVEGMDLPEISITIQLEQGEDLTGSTVQMILTRNTTDPNNPDIIEKTLIEISNEPNQHWIGKVSWEEEDLIPGYGQQAIFILTNSLGEKQALARWNIDVLPNPDPTP